MWDERILEIGAIAQLGERLHGMQEVSGSIPLGSTNFRSDASLNANRIPVITSSIHLIHSGATMRDTFRHTSTRELL